MLWLLAHRGKHDDVEPYVPGSCTFLTAVDSVLGCLKCCEMKQARPCGDFSAKLETRLTDRPAHGTSRIDISFSPQDETSIAAFGMLIPIAIDMDSLYVHMDMSRSRPRCGHTMRCLDERTRHTCVQPCATCATCINPCIHTTRCYSGMISTREPTESPRNAAEAPTKFHQWCRSVQTHTCGAHHVRTFFLEIMLMRSRGETPRTVLMWLEIWAAPEGRAYPVLRPT